MLEATPSKVSPLDLDLILRLVSSGTNFVTNTQPRLNAAVNLFHATGAQLNVAGKACVNYMIFKLMPTNLK